MADKLPPVPEGGFEDNDGFFAWLSSLNELNAKSVAQVLSCRASLRILPNLHRVLSPPNAEQKTAQNLAISNLRANAVSRVALKYPSHEVSVAALSSVSVYNPDSSTLSAASAALSAATADPAAFSAASGDPAASFVLSAHPTALPKDYSDPASFSALSAALSARAAQLSSDSSIWQSITADTRAILSGITPQDLLDTPLWSESDLPAWWEESRKRLQARFELFDREAVQKTGKTGGWSKWSQWYNAVARGRPPWGLSSEAAWELEKRVALGDDRGKEFWERDPEEVNHEIAAWVEEARFKAFKLPEPPEQVSGLKFGVVNKLIRLVRYSGLASDDANLERIQGQLPLLRRLVRKLERRLSEGELPRDNLVESLSALGNVLDRTSLDAIGVAELYANTLVFRDQLAEAQTPITGANVFPFDGPDLSSAKSIVTISDMIVQATPEGRELFDDAEKSDFDAGEFEKYRQLELELLDRIAADGRIMDADELSLLKNILLAGNRGPAPRKTMHLSSGSMRNVVNTLTGAGVVGAIGYVVIANPIGAIAVGFFARLFLGEGIKQSVVGKTVNGFITDRIDRSMVDFFLKNRDLLEKISKDRRGYDWTREILEKIKMREEQDNDKN